MSRYLHLPQRAVVLSFEGPDRYSFVGGLGVRATELCNALDDAGIDVDLIFIGDPNAQAVEARSAHITLRRWAQWISAYHPRDVYDGQEGKIVDYGASVPPFVVADIVEPAIARGERVAIFAEDWQVVSAVLGIDALLRARGLRDRVAMLWNANNTYGFDTIDFRALERACQITAVSRYMKFELAREGVGALVVPNGIPERIFDHARVDDVKALVEAFGTRQALLKVGRFDPDKRWMQAIGALALRRDDGDGTVLLVRGGKEPYGEEVFALARALDLRIAEITLGTPTVAALASAIRDAHADILDIRSFLPDELLFTLYGAVDAVLANSGKEPFGLVGLEVMASAGIAVVGSTGEDYARAFENALVVDTDDPHELAAYLRRLRDEPALREHIRERAPQTAHAFTWASVLDILDAKVGYVFERSTLLRE